MLRIGVRDYIRPAPHLGPKPSASSQRPYRPPSPTPSHSSVEWVTLEGETEASDTGSQLEPPSENTQPYEPRGFQSSFPAQATRTPAQVRPSDQDYPDPSFSIDPSFSMLINRCPSQRFSSSMDFRWG